MYVCMYVDIDTYIHKKWRQMPLAQVDGHLFDQIDSFTAVRIQLYCVQST